jgi:hypothetical protein
VVAVVKATGHPADHVRWEMPLSEAWPYYHAGEVHSGSSFRWPADAEAEAEWLEGIRTRALTLHLRKA